MNESRRDEEPSGSVQRPPAVVVAEHAANVAHDRYVSPRAHEATQGRWRHGLPARQDRPHRQSRQPDRSDRSERPPERRAVRARRQKDVGCQQDQPGDRHAAMPDCRPVDPVEPLFHPRQGADQHETDRQQQNRLAAEKLPEVTREPARLPAVRRATRRPCRRRGHRSSLAQRLGRRDLPRTFATLRQRVRVLALS